MLQLNTRNHWTRFAWKFINFNFYVHLLRRDNDEENLTVAIKCRYLRQIFRSIFHFCICLKMIVWAALRCNTSVLVCCYCVGKDIHFVHNENRSAWTCWRSINDERKSTSSRKNHFLGLCFNVFKRCACPVSLTCIHTQHQAMWRRLLAVETLPIDRWHIARTTGEDLRARSIAIDLEVKHETLPANRTRLLAAPVDLLPVLAVDLLACSRRRFSDSWRSSTGHDRSQCTTTKDRWRKRAAMAALWSFLLDRLDVERSIFRFPSPLHASEVALRILAKGNWKIDSFLWGGRFGRSLLCPGRAEKKTRGSWPPTGCLPVDRNKLGPDSWRDEKGVWYRTDTHARTHTELKPCGPPGPRR